MKRLFPAASAAALVAALAHVIGLTIASRHVGPELIYIGVLTYVIALVAALPIGVVLLAIVSALRLGPIASLALFLAVAQVSAIALAAILLDASLTDLPWQYAIISIPAPVVAWYLSVYSIWKKSKTISGSAD